MLVLDRVREMQRSSMDLKARGNTIGFVPTMGYLHEGHLSLLRGAREECDKVVASIFVNPTQFGPDEDFQNYPRDLERDKKLMENEGVDVLFAPTSREMYPLGFSTDVIVEGRLTSSFCAASRSGHFKGVTTVVAKLFNIVCPDIAYFGQKDAQQAAVIKKMVKDLNMHLDIKVMPIIREKDGLAMSSRNTYLSAEQREQALGLYGSLQKAEDMVASGIKNSELIMLAMEDVLAAGKEVKIDYIGITDPDTLEPVEKVEKDVLVLVAANVGNTRLIDNKVIEVKG